MERAKGAQPTAPPASVLGSFDEEQIDEVVQAISPSPTYLSPQEEKTQPRGRLVSFKEAVNFSNRTHLITKSMTASPKQTVDE